jgi:MYXO-CTERM domain-containing protein
MPSSGSGARATGSAGNRAADGGSATGPITGLAGHSATASPDASVATAGAGTAIGIDAGSGDAQPNAHGCNCQIARRTDPTRGFVLFALAMSARRIRRRKRG